MLSEGGGTRLLISSEPCKVVGGGGRWIDYRWRLYRMCALHVYSVEW